MWGSFIVKKFVALLAFCCAMPADASLVTLKFTGNSYMFQGSGSDYLLLPSQVSYYTQFGSGVPYSFTFT